MMGETVQDILKKGQKKLLPVKRQNTVSMCALCRGTKLLCGKARCPVIVRFHSKAKAKSLVNTLRLGGASPPSVFVGRIGYPKVSIARHQVSGAKRCLICSINSLSCWHICRSGKSELLASS